MISRSERSFNDAAKASDTSTISNRFVFLIRTILVFYLTGGIGDDPGKRILDGGFRMSPI
jgi:hypothetical protein